MIYRLLGSALALAAATPALAVDLAPNRATVSDALRFDFPNNPNNPVVRYDFRYNDPATNSNAVPSTAVAAITDSTIKAIIQSPAPGAIVHSSTTDLRAEATAGALHVSASYSDLHAAAQVNSYLIASATFSDSFTVLAPDVGAGSFTGHVLIDGSTRRIGGNFATAIIADINFTFYDANPLLGPANVLGGLQAHEDNYGPFFDQITSSATNLAPGQSFYGQVNDFEVAFTAGTNVFVTATATCTVSTGTIAVGGDIDAACDLGHSIYWQGITNIRDSNNDLVTGATIASASGFNYLLPSPQGPGGSPTPEPSVWALLIGGFGLTGGALRRRRVVAA